jgi:hypothetical protein
MCQYLVIDQHAQDRLLVGESLVERADAGAGCCGDGVGGQ